MTCETPPRARWKSPAWLFYTALTTSGIVLAGVSIVLTEELTAVLPYIAAALFFVGTSGGAVTAAGIGSVLKLVAGAPNRRTDITEECRALQHRMSELAAPICQEPRIAGAVAEASYQVARLWPDKIDNDAFRWYLMCQTVVAARKLALADGSSGELDSEQLRRVVRSLHVTCEIPSEVIARMLDIDVGVVREKLRAPGTANR